MHTHAYPYEGDFKKPGTLLAHAWFIKSKECIVKGSFGYVNAYCITKEALIGRVF